MQFNEIITTLSDYCDANNIVFIYGTMAYAEWEASQKEYQTDQLILVADISMNPTIRNGRVTTTSYNVAAMLGRKFEATTQSDLNETYIQKYNNRLKDLIYLFAYHFGAFSCANDLVINGLNCRFDINRFDENIDFVAGQFTWVL